MHFITDALLVISPIFPNFCKTWEQIGYMQPLGCVVSLWYSLRAFTFIILKVHWVRNLEIWSKINSFYQMCETYKAYGLSLVHLNIALVIFVTIRDYLSRSDGLWVLRLFLVILNPVASISRMHLHDGFTVSGNLFEMLCAIWYHLYNLRNVKNTHRGALLY